MAGTKMTLYKHGGPSSEWKDQNIKVDNFNINTINPNLIVPLEFSYEMGLELLDVFYNGHRLSLGTGYTEVDNSSIQLNLGNNTDGTPIGVNMGDEIYVRYWESRYLNYGSESENSLKINDILAHIDEITNYGGASNLELDYEYNSIGQIVKETATGDHNIVREFTYNTIREIETETIFYKDKKIIKSYTYNLVTHNLTKVSVSIEPV